MGGAVARVISRPKPTPAPAPVVAPTAPEVSQATATSMDGYDARKTKAKGRSTTILTGPKGVEEETLTLGKRSLLGQ
jgi:hypothetical protein|nr:hypothetical protein [uncultured Mediterranean phage uvMED]BAR37111.1 hypothetical protein [uncultured Mediterranean phage uvMED]